MNPVMSIPEVVPELKSSIRLPPGLRMATLKWVLTLYLSGELT